MGEKEIGGNRIGHEIMLNEDVVKEVEKFKYLGSVVQKDGGFEEDIKHRIKCGRVKWREASGVLCDKRIPIRLKGEYYKSVVRPAMMYGMEC